MFSATHPITQDASLLAALRAAHAPDPFLPDLAAACGLSHPAAEASAERLASKRVLRVFRRPGPHGAPAPLRVVLTP